MCFALPKRVKKVKRTMAFMEDGQKVKLSCPGKVNPGDYLRIYGNIAVQKLEKRQALKIRRIIKMLK